MSLLTQFQVPERNPRKTRQRQAGRAIALLLGFVVAALLGHPAFGFWGAGAATNSATSAGRNCRTRRLATATDEITDVSTETRGEPGTAEYRRFFLDGSGKEVSPWHDLPLAADAEGEYWMVTEIPKMTKAKMEIATKEADNPIAQDEKKGKLRDYHGPIYWNYGCLPRTWEDPLTRHPELEVLGDNDPVDVVEIGSRVHEEGSLNRVKVLGALAMIDDGELDWKVIAVSADDPLSAELNDVEDVEEKMPGVVSGIREWFRWYKTPDGKPLNEFGFDGRALGKEETLKIIEETHEAWRRLRAGETDAGKLWTGST